MDEIKNQISNLHKEMFILDMKDKWDNNNFTEYFYMKNKLCELESKLWEMQHEN